MATVFKTAYGVYQNPPTSSGCDEVPDFGYVKKQIIDYDVDGKSIGSHEEIVFEKTGSHSMQDYINSFEDTTDIKKIFERYQAGDVSVLTKRVGEYIDTLGCPDNLLDAKLMLLNGENAFNQLPASIREKYDNDALKFVQACQDGSISDVLTGLKEENDSGDKTIQSQKSEIEQLRAQLAELQKGGVSYE